MSRIYRKITLVLLVLFALAITGCLSNNTQKQGGSAGIIPKLGNNNGNGNQGGTDPIIEDKDIVYVDHSANKAPFVTSFIIEELDSPVVEAGQEIELSAKGLDPEGNDVSIKFEATGGTIAGNKWTAPKKGGMYEIKAFAYDGELTSDPEIITLTVPGDGTGIQLLGITTEKINKNNAPSKGPSRAITSGTATSTGNKVILETDESINITLAYTSDVTAVVTPEYSVASNEGSITISNWDLSGPAYSHTYVYTAPSTVPTGNTVTLTFNIVNPNDDTDYTTASKTFIINTVPTIGSVTFSGSAPTSITPSSTKTVNVSVSDADSTSFTYTYTALEGGGTFSESSNSTGSVDYTASATTGTAKILILVTDDRGSSTQSVFTFTNASPMYAAIADDDLTDQDSDGDVDYNDAVYNNADVVLTAYDVSYFADADGEAFTPRPTDDDTADAADTGMEIFVANVPSGTATYSWADSAATGSITASLFANLGAYADNTVAAPDYYATLPGVHTITTTTTDSSDTNISTTSTETIYVNEAPNITSVYYTDADGNNSTLWNGTTVTPAVLSPGSLISVNTSISDADNTRVSPTTDDDGYFSDTSAKFLAKVIDTDTTSFTDDDGSNIRINAGSGYTNQGTAAAAYKATTSFSLELYPGAAIGTEYLVLRAKDGYDNIADGTAAAAITTDHATVVGPDADGIAKAADSSNTFLIASAAPVAGTTEDFKTWRIGFDMTKTHYAGNFYIAKTSTADTWKVYDINAGAYIKDSNSVDITIDDSAANHDGTLLVADALAAPYDWILIDMGAATQGAGGSGANGYTSATVFDKVYFNTYADQVVIPITIQAGPKITSVAYNKYVTVGDTATIIVYGRNDTSAGNPTGAATVSLTEVANDGGVLAQGTDSDGDVYSNEVWTYTAPASFTSSTVTYTVKIADDVDPTKFVTRDITFYLNNKPTIGSINATSNVDTTDNAWIKYGTHNINLSALVSDADSGDKFGYIWTLPFANTGSLNFAGTSSAVWDPYNGATALTANGGTTLNGQYKIQVSVYDKDSGGAAKGGMATRTITIGVNENPDVTQTLLDNDDLAGTNGYLNVTAWSASAGSPWQAATDVARDALATNVTTIDFDTNAQYPGVKLLAYPTGVNDETDDRDSLNYSYFMTVGTPSGSMLTTETFEYFTNSQTTPVTLTNKGLKWTPSVDIRSNGGTFYINHRVTDDKYGVAKGIKTRSDQVIVVADTTAPDINAVNDTQVLLDGTDITATMNQELKAGETYTVRVFRSGNPSGGDNFPDLGGVVADFAELIADGGATGDPRSFELRDNSTPTNPTDDYYEYNFVIPVGTADSDLAGNDVSVLGIQASDISGNYDALGQDLTATHDLDNTPPVLSATVTNNMETNAGGENDDGAAGVGNALNGNTGLDLQTNLYAGGAALTEVLKIGDRLDLSFAFTNDASDTQAASALRSAAIAYISDFVGETPVSADNTTYSNNTAALNAWISAEDAVSLSTAGANTAVIADAGAGDTEDLVLNENRSIQSWDGAAGDTSTVKVKATDNAKAATAANAWPAAAALGNMDEENLVWIPAASNIDGIDLKRPEVTSVEIYSYDPTATAGQIGYAPLGDRAAAANDKAAFALIDNTLLGVATTDTTGAKAALNDGDATTAEIIKISFDEPLLVQSVAAASNAGNVFSTLNDLSTKIYEYRNDGVNKDDISTGAKVATAGGGHDVAELKYLKNFAYVETSNGDDTDTSIVYIVLQTKQLTETDVILPAIAAGATGNLVAAGADFTDDLSVGDLLEIFDNSASTTQIVEVVSITNSTTAVVKNNTGAILVAVATGDAADTITKAVDHKAVGKHFEVIFNDYSTGLGTDGAALDGDDQLAVLTDSHGNAINASANNYIKGNKEISW